MVYDKIQRIKKDIFSCRDIATALGVEISSARVAAARLVKRGLIVRAKRDVYIITDKWHYMAKEAKFAIANLIQVPSYISLMTALDYYGITTQVQRDFIESVAVRRTKESEVKGTVFMFTKIDKKLYFGFVKKEGFFIASPEKAFMDALYLSSLKRYSFDMTSIDLDKFDKKAVKRISAKFPKRTNDILRKLYG